MEAPSHSWRDLPTTQPGTPGTILLTMEGSNMSEPTQDDNQTGTDNAMKTVLDLEVEKLKGEVADLRAKYEASILEYQNANKELWAMAHSQQATQPVVTQQVEQPREPSVEGFVKQFKQE